MTEESLLHQALAKVDAAERATFLQICAGKPELRGAVEALLAAQSESSSALAAPEEDTAATLPPPARMADDTPWVVVGNSSEAAIGVRIGPYRLLQKLGEGGMGTVWDAEQIEPVKRRVALKVIKSGMASEQVVRRFEAERQALALMDHTNIAKVFDGGLTARGRPYFVMELVKGVPITRYCDELHLPIHERLQLLVPVCHAIQHAHQKGIIHRDIKPANVLVEIQDGKPVPKVIDFGVAKALHHKLTEGSMYTELGQIVGTLEYMSPEQAELSALDVDTRTDVYALGVLLYELLTGTTPIDRKRHKQAAYDEMLRLIREVEPPNPSTRLSESKDSLASVAAQRRTEPTKLTKAVRGELDWVVMKCLEKDRTRRYETANALARDIERYLDDEPVEACPPSARYRLGKFLRRHKGPVVAAGLLLMTLVGGIVGTSWGLVRAANALRAEARAVEEERQARNREAAQRRLADEQRALAEKRKELAEANEKRAVAEKQIAEAVRSFLLHDLLRQADATEQANSLRQLGGGFETKENPTVKELLERAAAELTPERIDARFPGQREVQASILRTVGDAFRGIGDYGKSAELLTWAYEAFRDSLGPNHDFTLGTQNNLALTYLEDGKFHEATELLESLRDTSAELRGAENPETLTIMHNLAMAYHAASKLPRAIELLERVRDEQMKQLGADHPLTLATLNSLARALHSAGRLPEAIELRETAFKAQLEQLGADHPSTLATMNGLAVLHQAAGHQPRAIELFERVREMQIKQLGADHPDTLVTLNNLATAYRMAGRLPEAIQLLERVRDAKLRKLGADHPSTLATLNNLAVVYYAAGRSSEAVKLLEKVRDAKLKTLGAEHQDTLTTVNALAAAYRGAGKLQQAIELFEQVREARVKQLGADHPDSLVTLNNLAITHLDAAHLPEAIELFEQVRDGQVNKLGIDHPSTLRTMGNLAGAYSAAGNPLKAVELFEMIREAQVKQLGIEHPDTLLTLHNLAAMYRECGKTDEALPLFQQAAEGIEKQKFLHAHAPRMVGSLIECHEALGKFADAETWRRKWLAVVKERAGAESQSYAEELAHLGRNLLKQKKSIDAESVMRECLTLTAKLVSGSGQAGSDQAVPPWKIADTQSMLGEALAQQGKYAEAEPLLVAGYEQLKESETMLPTQREIRLTESLRRLVDFYVATGQTAKADEWRAKLDMNNQR